MLWPNGSTDRPTISDDFGYRGIHPVWGTPAWHYGTDFVGFDTVRAIDDGEVIVSGTPAGWSGGGTQVWIQHAWGVSRSLHLDSRSVGVGDYVTAGQPIGVMGMTGTATGVHLHLEVVVDGDQIDPVPFITDRLQAAPAAVHVPEEDTVMSMITTRWNGQHIFTVGPRFLEHETDIEQARQAGWLLNRESRMGTENGQRTMFVEVGNDGLNRIQRTFGIPWYAFDLVMAGRAFDLEGNFGRGRLWSKDDEALAAVQGVQVRTDGLAKTLDELIAKTKTAA
ncbi:M23 family metallopeptidase [Microbacterium resistens]